ncbi:hypothetical protein HPB50_018823 [Hyalomma asiaticum]|uniref:Uncharacterized protein n=1 Tax=Hyalomma asiaticum TaxID=266040 RepID=A0ACB7T8Q0_HYAAI|nr:hypothetical protein HPB50_018823 [Hyalomma asiaticum]
MLFNLTMLGLPPNRQDVDDIQHSIYAGDIYGTIWTMKDGDGQIETRLQEAITKVEDYLKDVGLCCSPIKSELLMYRPTLKGRPQKGYYCEKSYEDIELCTQDGAIISKGTRA